MASQAPWSPTAHAFAHHQFSHVANFWKQGRQASFRLEALASGQAELNLTFQLPPASEVIPPPSHVFPASTPQPQRPIPPLFPNGFLPQRSGGQVPRSAVQKKITSKQRKSYRRSVLHKAALAAPSLPPPKNGSLRQAALASVQRLQADPASPANTQSTRKRSYSESDSPNVHSPSTFSPLAQRIRSDLQISEESPERRELLRTQPSPLKSPSLSPPGVKGFPPPAPLAFTPSKIQEGFEIPFTQSVESVEVEKGLMPAKEAEVVENIAEVVEIEKDLKVQEGVICRKCDAPMTPGHQCELESDEIEVEDEEKRTTESEDSDNGCENDFPAIDVSCDNWEEKFNESVKRFHNIVNCENCDGVFTPDHQC